MGQKEIIARLLELPRDLETAERTVLRYDKERRLAARLLEEVQDRLLLDGLLDGKNAETRSAQAREQTADELANLDMADSVLASAKAQLHRLQAEHSSLKAITRLLAGT